MRCGYINFKWLIIQHRVVSSCHVLIDKVLSMTNQTVTGSRLTGYIVNVMRFPVIERLMVRGSQVAIKHAIHNMVTRTLLIELL